MEQSTDAERIRRLQIGLIRSFNYGDIVDRSAAALTDAEVLRMFGPASRPMAEALYEVLTDMIQDGVDGPRP